jgi:peptide/nickel transport system substrate-binding protein
MLARVGVDARLTTLPVRNYWPTVLAGDFDMYMIGWWPVTFDAENPIRFLVATQDEEKKLGSDNYGGYSNSRIDALLPRIQQEFDETSRQSMLDEVHKIIRDDVPYVPLYVQPLFWGSKTNIDLTQRPDNFFVLNWVNVGPTDSP